MCFDELEEAGAAFSRFSLIRARKVCDNRQPGGRAPSPWGLAGVGRKRRHRMEKSLEQLIMERIERPGWVSTRGILQDPGGQLDAEEHRRAEAAMKKLAEEGRVTLWRLIIQERDEELLAAARPGFELDKDLEERGAWAKAVRYQSEP